MRAMHARAGRVGPNAITRIAEALEARCGVGVQRRVFAEAGLAHHLAVLPTAMVDERDVAALHAVLRAVLPCDAADAVSREAGQRTADYILALRLPRPVQALVRALPPGIAARLLTAAIARHAWTFAGSGAFRAERGHPLRLVIAGGPIGGSRRGEVPVCAYCAATFAGLFRALVHPEAGVREIACTAAGAPECAFAVDWPAGLTRRRRGDRDARSRDRAPASPPRVRSAAATHPPPAAPRR